MLQVVSHLFRQSQSRQSVSVEFSGRVHPISKRHRRVITLFSRSRHLASLSFSNSHRSKRELIATTVAFDIKRLMTRSDETGRNSNISSPMGGNREARNASTTEPVVINHARKQLRTSIEKLSRLTDRRCKRCRRARNIINPITAPYIISVDRQK